MAGVSGETVTIFRIGSFNVGVSQDMLTGRSNGRNYVESKVERINRIIEDAGGLPSNQHVIVTPQELAARGPSAHRDAAQLPAGRRPKEDAQLQTQ